MTLHFCTDGGKGLLELKGEPGAEWSEVWWRRPSRSRAPEALPAAASCWCPPTPLRHRPWDLLPRAYTGSRGRSLGTARLAPGRQSRGLPRTWTGHSELLWLSPPSVVFSVHQVLMFWRVFLFGWFLFSQVNRNYLSNLKILFLGQGVHPLFLSFSSTLNSVGHQDIISLFLKFGIYTHTFMCVCMCVYI